MLRNSADYQEVANRQRFPKHNYFCYRWRILDNFNRSIDRQMFHLSIQGADNHRSLIADKILQLYKARYHGTRQDLIVDLAQDAMKFLDKRRHEHHRLSKTEVLLSKATRELMDRAFNTLLAFSTELNSLLGLSELFITATEPEVKKRSNNSETSIAVYIQSHLSTSLFRLAIDGRQDTIKFYLIPADNILALTELSRYEAITTWKAQFDDQGRVYWVSDNGVLSEEMVDVACAELLRILLSTTQEGLSPTDDADGKGGNNYELLEADPWQRETQSNSSMSADFYAKSGHSLANSSSRFEYETVDDGWKQVADFPKHELSKPTSYAKPFVADTGSFSITISSGFEPVPAPAPAAAPAQNPVHTISSEGTRTDSVPSLTTLLGDSGSFSAQSEVVAPTIEATIANEVIVTADALLFTNEMPQKNSGFDLKSEYFADEPESKSSKKGVKTKRSTRKTNSKKGKKKNK